MSKSNKMCVVLTPEGINLYKDDVIKNLLKDEKYFICNSIKQIGYFLDMEVSIEDKGQTYDISIPMNYISYMISYDVIKKIGFKTIEC